MRKINYTNHYEGKSTQERIMLIRTSIRPYEEITMLSLANIASETKFQIYCKVKEKDDAEIVLSDEISEFKFILQDIDTTHIGLGDIVLAYGHKEESEYHLEHIIKLNLDWSLLVKARAVESL